MALTSPESPKPLEIILIPYVTPGHLVPLSEIGCLFASRNQQVTIITTTDTAPVVEKTIKQCKSSGHPISVHPIPFPYKDVGLPEGLAMEQAKDMDTATKYYHGLGLMRSAMQDFMRTRQPDCIIADKFFPWTSDFAETLDIPRIVFDPCFMFAKAVQEALLNPNSPHLLVKSDYEPFVITDLPRPITATRSRLPANNYAKLLALHREAEVKSFGVIINSMAEMEAEFSEYYAKKVGFKAFHVGPTCLIHENADAKIERSHDSVVSKDQVLTWLDSKNPSSVLYISFGSVCALPDAQLMEIACALESAGCDFIWVVRGKNDGDKNGDDNATWQFKKGKNDGDENNDDNATWRSKSKEGKNDGDQNRDDNATWPKESKNDGDENGDDNATWQPKEFNKNGKGLILKGWAPQLLILQHPSTGGFLTHCGSNSVMEAVLGIGVEVGVEDWRFFSEDRKIVTRDEIEKAVRVLMDGGDRVDEITRKSKELGDKAVGAMKRGGSSYENLSNLIGELKQLRVKRLEE
uniref:Tudor domain-containing protein n=1 Tax=Daucus carota subsp. sativus TaxID=79200 RepID=A0A175YHL6_DAUCS